jgi:hypothetical protein
MFREDYPPGRFEVLSKPPLGKCSINIRSGSTTTTSGTDGEDSVDE